MTEREALMRHIIDHPEDDDARLVMADWFDEHGEADRAEFVRLQVSLAREDAANPDEPVPVLTTTHFTLDGADECRRERLRPMRSLYARHQRVWTERMPASICGDVEFCRGFITKVRLSGRAWLHHAVELHTAAPIDTVTLDPVGDCLSAIALQPELGRVANLSLVCASISTDEGQALASSPHLRGLRTLNLAVSDYTRAGGGLSLLLGTRWPGLLALTLRGVHHPEDAFVSLACNTSGRSLRRLRLANTAISDADVARLAQSPFLGELVQLSLRLTFVGDEGILAFVRSSRLASLRQLELEQVGLSPSGLAALVAEPGFARLERFEVRQEALGNVGVIALANSPNASGLRVLELRDCEIENSAALALARSPHLTGLRSLVLTDNPITGRAPSALRERFGEAVEIG